MKTSLLFKTEKILKHKSTVQKEMYYKSVNKCHLDQSTNVS